LEVLVQRASFRGFLIVALAGMAGTATTASPLLAQAAEEHMHDAAPAKLSKDELTALAKVQLAIVAAHDSVGVEMALAGNKKLQAQSDLQDKIRTQVATILKNAGMTQKDYDSKTFLLSTDQETRKQYDEIVAKLTGAPLPGQLAPANAIVANLPAGQVGVHIGHVVNSFNDTPNMMGLLPLATAEASVAAQHAMLAARATTNLDQMKLHAGHVINAIDPTIIATGPGRGYGLKRAATGVATHIELAAKAPGASPNVVLHSQHIATASRNTVQRADSMLAIAKRIQAATTADEAAKLVNQLASLAPQLMAGMDVNNDGRITWEEGGLQIAQDHMNLMLQAEPKPKP
jgi:hypothetical protein